MNPLLSRLASLRRRVLLLEGWRGVCALATLVAGTMLVVGLLDWSVQLPSLIRALLLVGIVTGSALMAYRYLFVPFRSRCDNLTLALRIEEEFPELNDSLASTVQFLSEPADSPGAASGSVALRNKAVQQTVARSGQYDFSRIVSYRGAMILGVSILVIAAVAAHFAYRYPQFTGIALLRLSDPFGGHTWTTVDVPDAPTRVAQGQPLAIRAVLSGIIPRNARVEVFPVGGEQQRPDEKTYNLTPGTQSIRHTLDMTKYTKPFKFRVVANDGSYPPGPVGWHFVDVVPPPRLADLNGQPSPQVEVYPPVYTELPSPEKLPPGSKMIKAWAASAVVFRAATNREVANVWLEYRPRDVFTAPPVPAFRGTSLIGMLGATQPLAALGDLFVGQTMWDRVPAEIDASGKMFTVRFTPWVPGTMLLYLEDEGGLANRYAYELDVEIDPLPIVRLMQPATELTLLPDAEVTFRFQASDEIFALRSVFLEFERRGIEDKGPIGPKQRVVLQTAPGYEEGLPQLNSPLALAKNHATVALKTRPKRVDVSSLWRLNNQFKVGDVLYLDACADDYCDIYGTRPLGRSHQIKLQIVSKGELAKVIDEKLKQVQQEIVEIEKTQKAALDIVKEVEKNPKVSEKDIERLVEAEQLQKRVQDKVGTPDEGLRHELNKLGQLLKDNKMKDSEAQLQTGMIKGALDQLARQELEQIEPALAEARKKLAAQAAQNPKEKQEKKGSKEDRREDPLDRTAKLQDSALQNLKELREALQPWASMQQAKDEVRSILEQQQQIKKDVDAVKAKKEELENVGLSKEAAAELDKQLRDDMKKKSAELGDLAKRAEDVKKLIDNMQKTRQESGDKENAGRLKEASRIADKAALPPRMREIAKELSREPAPSNKAQQQQQKNIDNLERMLAALEGKDDVAEKLNRERHKKAQDDVDKLNEKMRDLEKKLQAANELKNEEERLQARKKLAQEVEKLRDEVEKEARELARLQEPRASKDLDKVANDLDQAAGKLKGGEDAGEEQKGAQENLQQAKKDLQQAEEELAREQLAKIADRLGGLKERQDTAIDRSKEFHRKLFAKKTWTDALGKTLEGDATAQEGLAKEVRSLKEKIKEAKVFEHIMERAAKAMDEAVQVMKDRKEEGVKTRQYDLKAGQAMEKEEIEDENEKSQETIKQQTQASLRLQRLIDAIKEELARKPAEEKKDAAAQQGDMPPQDGPRLRSGDGIPPVAQLRALKSEQEDLNKRTDDFARRCPETNNLTPEQRRELEQLEQDQRNLQELFRQMTANAERKGDAP
jgi:hypothetical protein